MFFSLFHELINHTEEAFGCFIFFRIFVKIRQSSLLQKTASTFEGVISVALKLGAIVPLWRSFQLHHFQCQMLIHSGVLHFEIIKCLILACTTLISNLKACVRYFLTNLAFSPNDRSTKTMKDVFYFI